MGIILTPDSVSTLNGVKVNEYLLTKHNPNRIAMPTASMAGKVIGVTVHNTDWITTIAGTTPAEQYTRATMNGNMNDVRVHYYVDNTCAWQNLPLDLSGWHAADGAGDGNRKTIAIECIMKSGSDARYAQSEDNCAKLAAYLLHAYGFNINHLYTHTHWLNVKDGKTGTIDQLNTMWNRYKMCPAYILPHWQTFKAKVQGYLDQLKGTATKPAAPVSKPAAVSAVKMTYDQFQAKYLGKAVDYDGVAGVQCVDLADQYLKDCFGITGVWVDGAKDFYNNFNGYPALVNAFTRVANTRDLVVEKGDLVVWGGGSRGHIAIGNGQGDKDWFVSLEENTRGRHEPTQLVKHYFAGSGADDGCNPVLGVLRPKDKSIKGSAAASANKVKTVDPYLIKVTDKAGLNIRTGPGISYSVVSGTICHAGGVYTIVAESTVAGQTWGKLKSGAGWICLTGHTSRYGEQSRKSIEDIAKEVIQGKWGAGNDRARKLTAAGYNYAVVQAKVNELLKK